MKQIMMKCLKFLVLNYINMIKAAEATGELEGVQDDFLFIALVLLLLS